MSERRFRLKTRWQIALRYSGYGLTTKAVGWALSTWWRAEGVGAAPSLENLADATGLHRATIARALKRLDDEGWVERIPGGGRGRRTAYRATIPEAADARVEEVLNGRTRATVSAEKPSQESQETVADARPFDSQNRRTGATRAFEPREEPVGSGPAGPLPDGGRTLLDRYREALGIPTEGGHADPETSGSPGHLLEELRRRRDELEARPSRPWRDAGLRILERQIAELEEAAG